MVQWTIEQPPSKPDKPLPRRHCKPMPRKQAWVNPLRVALVCFIFGLILSSYLLGALQQSAKPVTAAREATLPKKDAGAGRILVQQYPTCRELGFDNLNGLIMDKGSAACDEGDTAQATSESAYQHPIKRIDSIKRAFSRQ